MKKSFSLFLFLFLFSLSFAETVKLKDGTFISGSILSQTEYTINMTTSYGPVVLNQRDVEAVLPDKHRIYLKGGTQIVGVILDLDEFNMTLQTDEGVVNIDMPQIVSIDVYDYDQGNAAQRLAEENQARQAALVAAAAAAQQVTLSTATAAPSVIPSAITTASAATTSAGAVQAQGGLTFDADIDRVFDVQKAEVVNGQVQTVQEISAAEIRAQRAAQQLSDEQAFLNSGPGRSAAKTEEAITKTAEAARSGKLAEIRTAEAKRAQRPKDSATDKYFAIAVGAQANDLQLDNSERAGFADSDPFDVGGTGVRAEAAFLWRIKNSNLWLGPSLAFSNIPNSSFYDLDPAIEEANQSATDAGRDEPYPADSDRNVHTSGQIIDILVKANYYFNPDDLFSVYVTASGGYRMLSLNYRGVITSESISSSGFLGSAGLGVETHFDDLMIGLEVQEFFSPYSGDLKDSSSANLVVSAKFSWKF